MHVESVTLKNFRNYQDKTVLFKDGLNIIVGQNASGKTNLLESVYVAGIGRSPRTNKYKDMIRWGSEYAYIKVKIKKGYPFMIMSKKDYEWYERHWINNEFLSAPDPRAPKYTKVIKTDKGGWFTFVDLPPGEYYVGAVLCPCDGFSEKERSNFKYQRYGTKVRMKKSIKANLEKVFE